MQKTRPDNLDSEFAATCREPENYVKN